MKINIAQFSTVAFFVNFLKFFGLCDNHLVIEFFVKKKNKLSKIMKSRNCEIF